MEENAKKNEEYTEYLKKCSSELSEILRKKGYLKYYILEIFRTALLMNDWPYKYFELDNKILPTLIGEGPAEFLMKYIKLGKPSFEINMDEESLEFLKLCNALYGDIFNRVESYYEDPLGFDCVAGISNKESKACYINFCRNDGKSLDIKVDPEGLARLIEILIDTLEKVEEICEYKVEKKFTKIEK